MTHIFKIFAGQFIPFLAARRALDQYVSNFSADFLYIPLDEFIGTADIDCWISCAFDFENAPEGSDFWVRINKEWQDVARHF